MTTDQQASVDQEFSEQINRAAWDNNVEDYLRRLATIDIHSELAFKSVLHAVRHNSVKIVKAFVGAGGVLKSPYEPDNAFIATATTDGMLCALVEAGVDLNAGYFPPGDSIKSHPITKAISLNAKRAFNLMLMKGANLRPEESGHYERWYNTPIGSAIRHHDAHFIAAIATELGDLSPDWKMENTLLEDIEQLEILNFGQVKFMRTYWENVEMLKDCEVLFTRKPGTEGGEVEVPPATIRHARPRR